SVRDRIRREAEEIVSAEGPVLIDRLISLVGGRYGFGRIRESRRDQILGHIPRELIHRAANGDRVAWPSNLDPKAYREFRVPKPGSQRPIDEVPYEELRNALADVVLSSHGIERIDA